MSYIAFIPARSGSKRVKNKNIIKIKKKPLIHYTLNAAKKSKFISGFYISTDSKKIKSIAEKFDFEIKKLRPKYLTGDKISMHKLLKETIIDEKKLFSKYKYLVLLQPTSPLRTYKDIDNACKKFEENKNVIDCLVSTFKIKNILDFKRTMIGNHKIIKKIDKKLYYNGKDQLYQRNGPAILIIKIKNIKNFLLDKKICNFIMTKKKSIDINYYKDIKYLKKII